MTIASIRTNQTASITAGSIGSALDKIKAASIKLASGRAITEAKDDAAGLSIGIGLQTDKSTLEAALKTASQAMVVLSTADSAAENVSSVLARLKSLASQANSGALGSNQLGYIKNEMDALLAQVDNIVNTTKFNGRVLVDGSYSAVSFQVGVASTDTITVSLNDARVAALGISAIDVTTSAISASNSLDSAIDTVKTIRANIGAYQSRFSYVAQNIESGIENTTSAAASYLEANIGEISTELANATTLFQASISVLARSNSITENLLALLRN